MSKRRVLCRRWQDMQTGDLVVVFHDVSTRDEHATVIEVEREMPDGPTRIEGTVQTWHDSNCKEYPVVVVPGEWDKQIVTCILGKDELPEDVKCDLRLLSLSHKRGLDRVLGWAMTRWPEAFK